MGEIPSSTFLFSRLITTVLENSEYHQDVQTSMFLLLGLLNVFQVLFMVKKIFKNTTHRSALRLDSDEWQGVWDRIHKCLGQWSPPTFWNHISEQVQNPEKLVKYLEKVFCHSGNSRKTQIPCLDLTQAYWALLTFFSTLKGQRRSLDLMAKGQALQLPQPWQQALQLNPRTNTCLHQSSQYTKRNIGRKSEAI